MDKDCPSGFFCEGSLCVESDAGRTARDGGGDAGRDASDADTSAGEDHWAEDNGGDSFIPVDAGGDAGEEDDAGQLDVGAEPMDGGQPACSAGDWRCTADKSAIELCVGDSWMELQNCAPALCEISDLGIECGDLPDAGVGDAGVDAGDAGPKDCSSVDISATVSFCRDLGVASCDFEKKCNPDEFGPGGITIEECQQTVSDDCQSFARVALCCSGVSYDNAAAYRCVGKILGLTVLDCVSSGVSECSEKTIYPGYDEVRCGI